MGARYDRSAIFGFLAVLVMWAKPVPAQDVAGEQLDQCTVPHLATAVRPNADGPPTEVTVGVRMVDLMGIDDIAQTLTGDFTVVLKWVDPRLAGLEGCQVRLEQIWDPKVVLVNSGRKFPSLPEKARIGPGGQVSYVQRYGSTYATYHNLRDFPFDEQTFEIWLVPLEDSKEQVTFKVAEKVTGRRDLLNISDWIVTDVSGTVDVVYLDAFDHDASRFTFRIDANRITAYYVWKIILPLCLIVAMSWAVFWINPAQFGPQISLSATAMLTLIAFLFATTNMLPALGYFTVLDLFIGGATILVFLAMLEALTTSYLVSQDRAALAQRMDRISRFVFPIAFLILVGLVFLA